MVMKENINKYYIPEYSDIYIGQDLYTINGHKIDLSTVDSLTAFLQYQNFYKDCEGNITYGINLENYRLKYLDHIDIEELGFKLIFNDVGIEYWKLGNFELRTDVDLGTYIDSDNLYSIFYNPYGKQYNCVFSGVIKNKSELKKILNMLNIK